MEGEKTKFTVFSIQAHNIDDSTQEEIEKTLEVLVKKLQDKGIDMLDDCTGSVFIDGGEF